jgi:maltose alpha-D-glucosyltransferase/alpha-amylase
MNPELEIGHFTAERTSFHHVPPLAGALEYHGNQGEPITLGILQGLVSNQGNAWQYTLECLARYFEDALTKQQVEVAGLFLPQEKLLDWVKKEIPPLAQEIIGSYLSSARLLGQRTGELHVALASDQEDPAFAPELFSPFYCRSLYQSMRSLADQELDLLASRLKGLPEMVRADAEKVLNLKTQILNKLHVLLEEKFTGKLIRCHGDYHLGQLLYTGKDFVIIDFEGEPSRSVSERRLKRSPLRDVAGMLRSFHYAAISKLKSGEFRPEDMPELETWAHFWHFWVCAGFLQSYIEVTTQAAFWPQTTGEVRTLLDLYLLEKAIYEVGYELNHRPEWVSVPLHGILEMVSPVD